MNIKNTKVLLTGADGFIGSHLLERLVVDGYDVKAFVYYNSFNSWGWLDTLPQDILKSIEVVSGDIRSFDCVQDAMKGIDIVFHLAALISIPHSYHSPESFVDTNIKGTLNILQAARNTNPQKVLITSSSEVYGTARYTPIDEKHPLQGQSPYSATKIAADRISESFYKSFNLPVVIVRPFNTYGPRQSARAIIPTIITQLFSGVSSIRLGNLMAVRDFCYVDDTTRSFVEIAESNNVLGEEINVATGVGISMGDLANIIMEVSGRRADIVLDENRLRPKKSEVDILIGDNKKLISLVGCKPEYNLQKGLKETVQWFEDSKNIKNYKSLLYNF